MRYYGLILISLLLPSTLIAFNPPPPPTVSEVNDTEQPTEQELLEQAELEPQVTIIRRERETIEEYRVNGMLKRIKVIPDFGPAYYLVDSDGDGTLETSHFAIDSNSQVPQWILFSW